MELLRTEHISFTYGANTPFRREALRDVSVTVNAGELTGIIGHTGSGKSTLISHFNGLLKPDEGQVLLEGKNIWESVSRIRSVRFAVGLVFQYPEYQLFEETVAKDIAFGPNNMGLSETETTERVAEAADMMGLSRELLEKSPFELSGGQKRRVAIAGVLAMRPKVLVLDEPAAGLDPAGKDDLFNLLDRFTADGTRGAVIVSHSMDDIARYADSIYVMHNGSVCLSGTPGDIFAHKQTIEDAGLQLPFVSRILHGLAARGFDVDLGASDTEAAARTIAEAKKRGHLC